MFASSAEHLIFFILLFLFFSFDEIDATTRGKEDKTRLVMMVKRDILISFKKKNGLTFPLFKEIRYIPLHLVYLRPSLVSQSPSIVFRPIVSAFLEVSFRIVFICFRSKLRELCFFMKTFKSAYKLIRFLFFFFIFYQARPHFGFLLFGSFLIRESSADCSFHSIPFLTAFFDCWMPSFLYFNYLVPCELLPSFF